MGMFDTIRCEMSLPVEWPKTTFQTKSLGRQMDLYTITPAGTLVRRGHDYGFDDGGYRVDDARVPIDGCFEFYDCRSDLGILTLGATFVSGVCTRIEVKSWRSFPGKTITPPQGIDPALIEED